MTRSQRIALAALACTALCTALVFQSGASLPPAAAQPPAPYPPNAWSATNPPINTTHIFRGQIKDNGSVVGFHSRHNGVNPPNIGQVNVTAGPNNLGVYTANVEICNAAGNVCGWKGSSMFPNNMNNNAVLAAILHAYHNGHQHGLQFSGPSGLGFTINGWLLNNGRINTAYPIYVANPMATGFHFDDSGVPRAGGEPRTAWHDWLEHDVQGSRPTCREYLKSVDDVAKNRSASVEKHGNAFTVHIEGDSARLTHQFDEDAGTETASLEHVRDLLVRWDALLASGEA